MSTRERRDVLVVGAGPAGSAVAALLAARGHTVTVFEKERFPRFHIGESLLPACLPILERIGIAPGADTFVFKRGARFVCEESGRTQTFAFDQALEGCPTHAWHVERSLFDQRLSERAQAAGAEVRFATAVEDAGVEGDRAWVRTGSGRVEGRFLIDASGQSRLLARRRGSVRTYEQFGRAAVFTHYEGLGSAAREELGPDFDIRIVLRPEGWGWIIPLPSGRLSVGIVGRGRVTPEELESGLLSGPLVRRLTEGARRLETHIVGNFSYANTEPSGPRFAAIGDAACFLDPVFSSGVTLALKGAEGVAEALSPALEAGSEADGALLATHGAGMDRAYRTFAGLIDRFYNSNLSRSLFLAQSVGFELRSGVMSVLAGDVWRADNPFQEMLLGARRKHGRAPAEPPSV